MRFLSCSCVHVLFVQLVFVLSLFVPHISFYWYLRKAVLRNCDISWISSLIDNSPYTDTRCNDEIRYDDNLTVTKSLLKR